MAIKIKHLMNTQVYLLFKSFEVQSQSIIDKILDYPKNIELFKSNSGSAISTKRADSMNHTSFSTKQTANHLCFGQSKSIRSIRLPRTSTEYTVLRSPHVDKKSREQFEIRVHKHLFCIETDIAQINKLFLYLKQHSISGVQLKMTLNYKTRL